MKTIVFTYLGKVTVIPLFAQSTKCADLEQQERIEADNCWSYRGGSVAYVKSVVVQYNAALACRTLLSRSCSYTGELVVKNGIVSIQILKMKPQALSVIILFQLKLR